MPASAPKAPTAPPAPRQATLSGWTLRSSSSAQHESPRSRQPRARVSAPFPNPTGIPGSAPSSPDPSASGPGRSSASSDPIDSDDLGELCPPDSIHDAPCVKSSIIQPQSSARPRRSRQQPGKKPGPKPKVNSGPKSKLRPETKPALEPKFKPYLEPRPATVRTRDLSRPGAVQSKLAFSFAGRGAEPDQPLPVASCALAPTQRAMGTQAECDARQRCVRQLDRALLVIQRQKEIAPSVAHSDPPVWAPVDTKLPYDNIMARVELYEGLVRFREALATPVRLMNSLNVFEPWDHDAATKILLQLVASICGIPEHKLGTAPAHLKIPGYPARTQTWRAGAQQVYNQAWGRFLQTWRKYQQRVSLSATMRSVRSSKRRRGAQSAPGMGDADADASGGASEGEVWAELAQIIALYNVPVEPLDETEPPRHVEDGDEDEGEYDNDLYLRAESSSQKLTSVLGGRALRKRPRLEPSLLRDSSDDEAWERANLSPSQRLTASESPSRNAPEPALPESDDDVDGRRKRRSRRLRKQPASPEKKLQDDSAEDDARSDQVKPDTRASCLRRGKRFLREASVSGTKSNQAREEQEEEKIQEAHNLHRAGKNTLPERFTTDHSWGHEDKASKRLITTEHSARLSLNAPQDIQEGLDRMQKVEAMCSRQGVDGAASTSSHPGLPAHAGRTSPRTSRTQHIDGPASDGSDRDRSDGNNCSALTKDDVDIDRLMNRIPVPPTRVTSPVRLNMMDRPAHPHQSPGQPLGRDTLGTRSDSSSDLSDIPEKARSTQDAAGSISTSVSGASRQRLAAQVDMSNKDGSLSPVPDGPNDTLSPMPDDSLSPVPDDPLSPEPDDPLSPEPDDSLSSLPHEHELDHRTKSDSPLPEHCADDEQDRASPESLLPVSGDRVSSWTKPQSSAAAGPEGGNPKPRHVSESFSPSPPGGMDDLGSRDDVRYESPAAQSTHGVSQEHDGGSTAAVAAEETRASSSAPHDPSGPPALPGLERKISLLKALMIVAMQHPKLHDEVARLEDQRFEAMKELDEQIATLKLKIKPTSAKPEVDDATKAVAAEATDEERTKLGRRQAAEARRNRTQMLDLKGAEVRRYRTERALDLRFRSLGRDSQEREYWVFDAPSASISRSAKWVLAVYVWGKRLPAHRSGRAALFRSRELVEHHSDSSDPPPTSPLSEPSSESGDSIEADADADVNANASDEDDSKAEEQRADQRHWQVVNEPRGLADLVQYLNWDARTAVSADAVRVWTDLQLAAKTIRALRAELLSQAGPLDAEAQQRCKDFPLIVDAIEQQYATLRARLHSGEHTASTVSMVLQASLVSLGLLSINELDEAEDT